MEVTRNTNVTSRRRWALWTLALCVIAPLVAGCCCAGYHVGPDGLYNNGIKTVYVPMVEADTYRVAFAERLTEAICKKITEQTPYRLASPDHADSILSVKLTAENQTVSAYNRYDDTRQKNVNLVAVAVWRELHGDLPEDDPNALALSARNGVTIDAQSFLVPEMGQSTATAQQEAIDKLAAEIVNLMEVGW